MQTLLADAAGYGGYISIIKFAILVAMFYAWLPLVGWVNRDSLAVRANTVLWTPIISAAGVVGLLVWLLSPNFLIGLLIYIVAIGATALIYIIHRDSRVSDFERILTVDHIKNIFVDENKRILAASKAISFITANNNEVPIPKAKTPEVFGFKTACELFGDAVWRRTSDIVLHPGQKDYSVIYQIDGVATKQEPKTRQDVEFFVHYIKQLADLDANERRKPQTGRFKVSKDMKKIEWEVTTAGSTAGEQVRFRKLEGYSLLKLEDLGLEPKQLELLKAIKGVDKGLFIISGTKKSGVTSTFYTILRNHDPFLNNINSLERNILHELDNVTQHTFSLSDTGTSSYARKLQTILRLGPDIMGVADCEDSKVAELACVTAKKGSVIHVTIEAPSAIQALGKWLKLVPDKNLVVDTLGGIINQRLVRKLCDDCKQAYQPNQELLRKFNLSPDKIKVLYRPKEIEYKRGKPILCEKCQGTGFYGRTGIFEVIIINDELRHVMRNAKSLQEISSHFARAGMRYLQQQSLRKVVDGVTSIHEIIREFSSGRKPKKQKSAK